MGNSLFVAAHFGLGFLLGASAGSAIAGLGASVVPIAIGVVVLAIVGAVGWAILRRRRRRDASLGLETLGAWADAACPACLAVAAFGPSDSSPSSRV
jgi:hypothetical protein